MQTIFKIEGMSCDNCAKFVREALESVTGVESAHVDLAAGRAVVEGEELDVEELVEAVEAEGYSAQPVQ